MRVYNDAAIARMHKDRETIRDMNASIMKIARVQLQQAIDTLEHVRWIGMQDDSVKILKAISTTLETEVARLKDMVNTEIKGDEFYKSWEEFVKNLESTENIENIE